MITTDCIYHWPISSGRRNSTRIDERHGKPLDTGDDKGGREEGDGFGATPAHIERGGRSTHLLPRSAIYRCHNTEQECGSRSEDLDHRGHLTSNGENAFGPPAASDWQVTRGARAPFR